MKDFLEIIKEYGNKELEEIELKNIFMKNDNSYDKDTHNEDLCGGDSYREGLCSEDSCSEDSYSEGSYSEDLCGEDSYSEGSYSEDLCGEDSYRGDSYSEDSCGGNSYRGDSYREGSYSEDSCGGNSCRGDSCSEGSYSEDLCSKGSYSEGLYSKDSYDKDLDSEDTYRKDLYNEEYSEGTSSTYVGDIEEDRERLDSSSCNNEEINEKSCRQKAGLNLLKWGYMRESARVERERRKNKGEYIQRGLIKYLYKKGYTKLVEIIMSIFNVNKESYDEDGNTLLMLAVKWGQVDIVDMLLEKDVDVNAVNIWGDSALMIAVRNRNEEITRKLCSKEVDVNIMNFRKETALLIAVNENINPIIEMILDKGCKSINCKDEVGSSVLKIAMEYKNYAIVSKLIDKGANTKVIDFDKNKAVMFSVNNNDVELFKLLRDKGIDLNVVDNNGDTPLTKSIKSGYKYMTDVLLEGKGINIHRTDSACNSALMIAIELGYRDIAKKLIDRGIDVKVSNYQNETAMMKAKKKGYNDIVKLIKNKLDGTIETIPMAIQGIARSDRSV